MTNGGGRGKRQRGAARTARRVYRLVAADIADTTKLIGYAAKRFYKDHCFAQAASLSYTMLLAFVPLVAIAFAILSAFPVFDQVRTQMFQFLFEAFLPQNVEQVRERFDAFLRNTGQLTALGTVALAVAALILLDEIDTIFNNIWRQRNVRPILQRLTMYWAILTLTPLLIGGSVGVSSYITAQVQIVGETIDPALHALPFVLTFIALTFAYVVVPYRKVRLGHAMVGALVAAVLFEISKRGFAIYFSYYAVYETLYGALSVIPLFLVWVFLGWCAVLVGAELAAAIPEWRAGFLRGITDQPHPARQLSLGLGILWVLHQASQKGEAVPEADISRRLKVGPDYLEPLLDGLDRKNITRIVGEEERMLARDLDSVTIADVLNALDLRLRDKEIGRLVVPWRAGLEAHLQQAEKALNDAFSLTVAELFSRKAGQRTGGASPKKKTAGTR